MSSILLNLSIAALDRLNYPSSKGDRSYHES